MFDYTIKADGSQAVRESVRVEDSLVRIEGQVRRVGGALLAMSQQAKGPFDSMTQAMRAEAEVLERIQGPLRRYSAEVQALDSLYRKGVITQQQYNAEIERMNRLMRERNGIPPPKGVPGGPGGAPPPPKQEVSGFDQRLGGFFTAAAVIGSAKAVVDLADSYQNLSNRLGTVTHSNAELNLLMDRTHAIANATRSEWNATGEVFTRLTSATKSLGMSQESVLRLTSNMSMAAKLQGATTAEASAAMLQLSQAFSSGKLAGDEFRTVAESMPIVLDFLADSMHVSRGALKQLASEGKITAGELAAAFEQAGPVIQAQFEKMKPTIGQQWTTFKNDMEKTAGTFAEQAHLTEVLQTSLAGLGKILNDFAGQMGHVVEMMSKLAGSSAGGAVIDVLGELYEKSRYLQPTTWISWGAEAVTALVSTHEKMIPVIDTLETVNKKFRDMRDATAAGADAMNTLDFYARQLEVSFSLLGDKMARFVPDLRQGFFEMATGYSTVDKLVDAYDEYKRKLDAATAAARKFRTENAEFIKIFEAAANPRGRTTSKAPEDFYQTINGEMTRAQFDAFVDANEKFLEQQAKMSLEVREGLRGVAVEAGQAAEQAQRLLVALKDINDPRAGLMRGLQAGLRGIRDEIFDISSVVDGSLKSAFHGLEDNLVETFRGGKTAWAELASSIEKDLLRIALRIVEMRILLALGIGAGGGGAASGILSGIIGSGGAHATGGSYTERRSGGTDAHMVMFRMSTGERADFTPRGVSGGGGASVVNRFVFDPREMTAYIGTAAGQRAVFNVIKSNPRAFRAAMGRA